MRSRHQRTPMMYRSRLVVVESVHRCCSSFLARAKNSAFWIFKTRLKILHEHVTTTSPTFCYTSFRIPFYSSRAKKKKHFARTNSAHSWIALLTYEMTSKNKRGNTNFPNPKLQMNWNKFLHLWFWLWVFCWSGIRYPGVRHSFQKPNNCLLIEAPSPSTFYLCILKDLDQACRV